MNVIELIYKKWMILRFLNLEKYFNLKKLINNK